MREMLWLFLLVEVEKATEQVEDPSIHLSIYLSIKPFFKLLGILLISKGIRKVDLRRFHGN